MRAAFSTIEREQIHVFIRTRDQNTEAARLIVFLDGTAELCGVGFEIGFEDHPDAWRSAIEYLSDRGFEYLESGPRIRLSDFVDENCPDPIEAQRRWARSVGAYLRGESPSQS